MLRRRASRGLLGLLPILVACGTEAPTRPPGPNLLLVVIDTCRADRTGAQTTPTLARLAEAGVRASQAVSHVPQTTPSVSTLLTSRLPHRHGVRVNGLFRLGEDAVTLAEVLREAGYDTAGFVSAFPLDGRFGVAQGFDRYDADFQDSVLTRERRVVVFKGHRHHDFEQRADEATAKALAWLDEREAEGTAAAPFLLLVHYFDPHYPYEPPPGYERFDDPYDGELAFVDAELGRLLDGLASRGLDDATLVAVVGDHGEIRDPKRPRARHAGHVEEAVLRVPLVLHQPGALPAGRTLEAPFGLVDLAPTLLGLLGVAAPEAFEGRSRRDTVLGGAEDPDGIVTFETLYWSLEAGDGPARYGARGPRFTYLRNEFEHDGKVVEGLFEHRRDPSHRENLLRREGAAELEAPLAALRDATRELAAAEPADAEPLRLTPEVEERLRALGYLGQ